MHRGQRLTDPRHARRIDDPRGDVVLGQEVVSAHGLRPVIAHLRLQGEGGQLQGGPLVAARPFLQDIPPQLQVVLVAGELVPAGKKKEDIWGLGDGNLEKKFRNLKRIGKEKIEIWKIGN